MTATPDQEAADPQQIIAGLRRQLAECHGELAVREREALEQQTATAEVLQVINESRGDLKPVFDAILKKAVQFCGPACGALSTFDGEYYHVVSMRDYPPEYAAFLRQPWRSTPGGLSERISQGGEFLHVADIAADENRLSGSTNLRALCELGGARTALWIGLRNDKALIGLFTLYRQEVRPFTNKEIALVRGFAAQAVIAMENARLITGQREALDQQTATAEVLQVINASPGDVRPVFDAMLERAIRLCGPAFGVFSTFDGSQFHSVSMRGITAAWADHLRQPFRPTAGGRLHSLIQGIPYVHVEDIAADKDVLARSDNLRAMFELGGARTGLFIGMRRDKALVGQFCLFRPEVRAFSDKEIALLENFAAQAVIALENARLLGELREALERQTATAEVLRVINASPGNLNPVFEVILAKAHEVCGADQGGLFLWDGTHSRAVATLNYPADVDEMLRRPRPPVPEVGRLLAGERYTHIHDVRAVPNEWDKTIGDSFRARSGTRTNLRVPLRKDGALLGYITANRREVRPYSDNEIALLENFAAQAVIAMENARLINETREALEQQTATAEVLGVINASPGDLTPVFETILRSARDLCGIAHGSLELYDGETFRAVATLGFSDAFAEILRHGYPGGDSPDTRALIDGERFSHILDLSDTRDPVTQTALALDGHRTLLCVPLRAEGRLLGMIASGRKEVRAFSDKEIALLENFAAQAVIAMENARLINETREALEQQTATAEVLGVINANPGDLTPVFDAMLEKVTRLCEAHSGFLWTYDGERYHTVSTRNLTPAFEAFLSEPRVPGPTTGIARLATGESIVHFEDTTKTEAYLVGDPLVRATAELGGFRTVLIVPMRKDGALLGGFSIDRQEVRPFAPKQIELVRTFAAQAEIAMENLRLIHEQREALEQQTATAEVLQVINASPGDLAKVFNAVLEKSMRLCEASFGSLYTYDGERLHTVAQRGVPAAFAEYRANNPPKLRSDRGFGRILATKRVRQILDMTAAEGYRTGDPDARATGDLGGARTILQVPLVKDETVLGVLGIYRQEVRAFSDKQIALLESFAAQAVIAMENARLLNEIRQRQEELRITFENMGDGVAMFDETPRLVAWNSKFQEFFDVPDALLAEHRTYAEYIRYLAERGDYGADADVEDMVRQIAAMTGVRRTYERVRPDGRVIEIRNNPAAGGGFVLMFSDISERKRNEEAIRAARDAAEAALRDLKTAQANLIQAEKMASLGQLTAGIAHEIKNPLNFVNNFAELSVDLLDELKEAAAPAFALLHGEKRADIEDISGTLTSNLEKIAQHGKRADGIVRAMLEHSRGASGERRTVDINALADEALSLAYHGARAQDQSFNITLERDFGNGIAPIEVNPQDITRVFLNLFSNGFYATNKRAKSGAEADFKPALTVSTREAGDTVEIRVRDNGTGIPPDIRDRLFEPFFTTKPTGEGTGLGLSITYDIVTKAHGGTISVDSEVDAFTEFVVALPRGMFAPAEIVP